MNYAFTMDFTFNNMYQTTVYMLNGTDVETASDQQTIASAGSQPSYEATDTNIVYLYAKGSGTSAQMSINAKITVTRITPYEDEEEEEADKESGIEFVEEIIIVEPTRRRQYGLDVLTGGIVLVVMVWVPCTAVLNKLCPQKLSKRKSKQSQWSDSD